MDPTTSPPRRLLYEFGASANRQTRRLILVTGETGEPPVPNAANPRLRSMTPPPMSLGDSAALLGAGTAAGLINVLVGSGTMITFSVLLALGYPPVTANVVNATGLVPGSISGAVGYRRHLPSGRRQLVTIAALAAAGAVLGATVLLLLPPGSFAVAAVIAVLGSCGLIATEPWRISHGRNARGVMANKPASTAELIAHAGASSSASFSGSFAARRAEGCTLRSIRLPAAIALTSVYGGYFGAGLGIMLIAVLERTLPGTLHRIQAVKMLTGTMINCAAAGLFITLDRVPWTPVIPLGAGALAGGWIGAFVGQRIPQTALRIVIIAVGFASAVKLLI